MKKKKMMKKPYIVILAIVFFMVGTISVRLFSKSADTAVAINVSDTLNIMGVKNPITIVLDGQIKKIEQEILEEKRRVEEEKRLEEEKRIAEEKRLEEERVKEEERRKNGKTAFLTFDDGPSKKITPEILDILKEYDIKATFFILGKMVEQNPDILKRIYEEGHSIGHHSYSHNYKYIYKNTDNFMGEIKATEKAMKNVLGEDFETKIFRLPGGAFEKFKQKYLDIANESGYIHYGWNALNGDAEGNNLSKERLINRLKGTVKKQKELIILMHDTDAKKTTKEALPEIIEYLIKEGYEFRALDQNQN